MPDDPNCCTRDVTARPPFAAEASPAQSAPGDARIVTGNLEVRDVLMSIYAANQSRTSLHASTKSPSEFCTECVALHVLCSCLLPTP
ncbi:hypothetical protein RRF57_010312 [Xylaria bambusicola]|uniref:Uncharacterized protein n=1 Tax=Xylaria bambusicola TaxID=326684 RepID=A0AAN7UUT2_9PEZI